MLFHQRHVPDAYICHVIKRIVVLNPIAALLKAEKQPKLDRSVWETLCFYGDYEVKSQFFLIFHFRKETEFD